MVTSALIIFGLVYAFFDKPHLLQRPIKIEKIIMIIILFGTAIFSGFKEHATTQEQEAAKQTIDSLHGESKALLILVDTLRKDNKAAQKDFSEQLLSCQTHTMDLLAQYQEKVDSLTRTVISKEPLPTLTILEAPSITRKNKEAEFNYALTALNAEADIIDYKYSVIKFYDFDNKMYLDTPKTAFGGITLNNTSVIAPNYQTDISVFLDRVPSIPDSCFLAMEFNYKSKGGKKQPPLRKIYKIFSDKKTVREAHSQQYLELNKELTKWKIWSAL